MYATRIGNLLLFHLLLGFIYFLTMYILYLNTYSQIDHIISNSVFLPAYTRKYIFIWLIIVVCLQLVLVIIFTSRDNYVEVNYVINYVNCL